MGEDVLVGLHYYFIFILLVLRNVFAIRTTVDCSAHLTIWTIWIIGTTITVNQPIATTQAILNPLGVFP